MAGGVLSFTDDEMTIDEGLGYPRAYAKMCRDKGLSPYRYGPPFTFTPYTLQPHEALRAKELDQMFPIIDPKAKPKSKPKLFVSLLWKQLNHLGNAGFDPAMVRVDTYGNVLYYYADSASPLAWDIDHWFPCSRGGLTVPSNLRILQRKVCKKKHNKLELLVPWWDLQLGISINQFLSIFASTNSDFRHKAFSLLFLEGENEEVNPSQTVDSHMFPQHFNETQMQVGLAPAAIVLSSRESHDASSALKALDFNRQLRPTSSIVASRKLKTSVSKENEIPDMNTNPYQAIVMARDSLKQRDETVKMQAEIQRLDDEVNEMKQKNEEEKIAIQDLELVLIKRRRRAEKCRRLADEQSSYKNMLEKMIRDAMHQNVVYKEQVRLNQAASNALMARLEAQKAICDNSEKDLYRKYKQRDEIEKQIRPEWEQGRKRMRMDDTLAEERDNQTLLSLPGNRPRTSRSRMDDTIAEERENQALLALPGTRSRASKSRMDDSIPEEIDTQTLLSLPGTRLTTSKSRMVDDTLAEERDNQALLALPGTRSRASKSRMDDSIPEEIDTQTLLSLPGTRLTTSKSRMVDDTLAEERDSQALLSLAGTRPGTSRSRIDEGGDDKSVLSLAGAARPRTPRSRMDKTSIEERYKKAIQTLEQTKPTIPVHKELRVFLEEEQRVSEAAMNEERQQEEVEEEYKALKKGIAGEELRCNKSVVSVDEIAVEDKAQTLEIEDSGMKYNIRFPVHQEPEVEEDEESRRQRGKGNVEKWLMLLLDDTPHDSEPQYVNENETNQNDVKEEIQKENKRPIFQERDDRMRKEEILEIEGSKTVARKSSASEMATVGKKVGGSPSFERKERREKSGKERGLVRSESARAFRPIPSSPSVMLRKGVDCIRKKPLVMGDDDGGDEDRAVGNNFLKSSIKTIKKAVRI